MNTSEGRQNRIYIMSKGTDMSKKSKVRLRDPALEVTMRNHKTYPSAFLTHQYNTTAVSQNGTVKKTIGLASLSFSLSLFSLSCVTAVVRPLFLAPTCQLVSSSCHDRIGFSDVAFIDRTTP